MGSAMAVRLLLLRLLGFSLGLLLPSAIAHATYPYAPHVAHATYPYAPHIPHASYPYGTHAAHFTHVTFPYTHTSHAVYPYGIHAQHTAHAAHPNAPHATHPNALHAAHAAGLTTAALASGPAPTASLASPAERQPPTVADTACQGADDGLPGVCSPAGGCPPANSSRPLAARHCPAPATASPPVCCRSDSVANRMCRMYIDSVYHKSPRKQRKWRLAGGEKARPCEFPHMAQLGFGRSAGAARWRCGGALVSELFVLTAAHCFSSSAGEPRWVRLGALNERNDSREARDYAVAACIAHPDFRPSRRYNDIGLVRLARAAAFSDAVRPACLHAQRPLVQRTAIATGWGDTAPLSYKGSDHLMKVELHLLKTNVCVEAYMKGGQSSSLDKGFREESMICAGVLKGGRDTCQGDSGGPLQVRLQGPPCVFSVLGVTSFGRRLCGGANAPGVYTRVAHFARWIEGVVWPPARRRR